MNQSMGNVHFNEFLGRNVWLYGVKYGQKNLKTSHVQKCQNVLNEDTSVAGEHGLYPHKCGWQYKRSGVRGRLRV